MLLSLPQAALLVLFGGYYLGVVEGSSEGFDASSCVHCPEYVDATAAEKEAILYDKIVSTEYPRGDLPPWVPACDVDPLFEGVDFNNIFDRFSDERPANFHRFFHFSGIVASVKFEASEGTSFTGLFKGADHGVLRFSPLAPLLAEGYLVNYFMGTFLFSFGLKLFRDGMHSGNFVVGDSAKGFGDFGSSRNIWTKPDFNIFSRPLDNMPGIGGEAGERFHEYERFSGVLSTSDVAAYDKEGNEEPSPVAPIIVQFHPNQDIANKFGKGPSMDFREWATTEDAVPAGTVIYTAWTTINIATREPSLCVDSNGIPQVDEDVSKHCPDQELVKVGEVVMTSRFHTSEWVDKSLFFQHTRMCPKDQTRCVMEDPDNPPPTLTVPATTYAGDDAGICVSDEEKDGLISGNRPPCPPGSEAAGDYCYPGELRKVKDTQVKQCPFMNLVTENIKFPTSQTTAECGGLAQFSRAVFLESFLFAFSFFMRPLDRLFHVFF
jgi:hypothetical protein